MVRQLFCSVYCHRITSSYRTIYWKPRIIFLKRPAFHSKHFRFSEHEKRKDQNNLKPHYKIAPKGAGLPYQICENKILVLFSYTILSLYWIDFKPILKKYLPFTVYIINALRCNGFVAGPNSAGSFYILSYHTLLWKTCFKCPAREIHSPSGMLQIFNVLWTVITLIIVFR